MRHPCEVELVKRDAEGNAIVDKQNRASTTDEYNFLRWKYAGSKPHIEALDDQLLRQTFWR